MSATKTKSKARKSRPVLSSAIRRHPAHRYALDVVAGQIVACRWVRLACQRYLDDLVHGRERGLRFDPREAQDAITYCEQLEHVVDPFAGQKIHLEPWEQFILWNLYGWIRKDGTRRFRVGYISVARKNGKTTLLASLGNYHTHGEGEVGARVYAAATKRDQARELFDISAQQIRRSVELREVMRPYRGRIVVESTNSYYTTFGRDSETEDGRNPSMAMIDEYHAHPDSGMFDVVKSGMASRAQPLLLVITTAGFDKACACYVEQHDRAEPILEGTIEDDSYFAIIFTLDDPDKEWTQQRAWEKANPNLGVSVSVDFLREQVREASQSPAKRNAVLTKNFNVWTEAQTRWILAERWARNGAAVDEAALHGRPCFGAFDLASTIDITAWVLEFPPVGSETLYQVLYRFFMPEDRVRERTQKDRVPYDVWVREGFISATPGDVIDYAFVRRRIIQDARTFRIQEVGFDPYNATDTVTQLQDLGLQMIQIPQTYAILSPASKKWETDVLAARFATGANPVMAWMVSCTEVKANADDGFKPVKPDRRTSAKRIDGVIASIMAHSRAVLFHGRERFVNDPTPRPAGAGLRGKEF